MHNLGGFLHTGGRHFDSKPIKNKRGLLFPRVKSLSSFYGSFRYIFLKNRQRKVTFHKYSCRAKFLMCSAAYLFVSRRQKM